MNKLRRHFWRTAFVFVFAVAAFREPPAAIGQTGSDRGLTPIRVERRLAFVVGNSSYPKAELRNPVNDARAMSRTLQSLGFTVTERENLTRRDFETQFNAFARSAGPNDLALFYFGGHGVQVQNENYLLPVDFAGESETDVKYEAIPASRIRERLEETGARVRVLIFDACRNNPFKFRRDLPSGLAAMANAAEGTIIAFAAGDNQTADDNRAGSNGLYTTHLLEALARPGVGLKEVFEQTRAAVWQASGKKQFPALYDMLIGKLVLKGGDSTPAGVAAPPPSPGSGATTDLEETYWRQCEQNKGAFCQAYLGRFPQGKFAELAKLILSPPVVPAAEATPAPVASGPRALDVRSNGKDGLRYVWIPPGRFRMGCSVGDSQCDADEKPVHDVEITRGFWMGQTEVTVAAWERYRQATGKAALPVKDNEGRPLNGNAPDRNMPAVAMTWDEAREYCGWAMGGGRLPTEAEWEYAARGGSQDARYGALDEIGWYGDNSGSRQIDSLALWKADSKSYWRKLYVNGNGFHAVGGKRANGFKLYDVLGNVWEWVEDWYGETYYANSEIRDPIGPPSGEYRVLRGGSWVSYPTVIRVSGRSRVGPSGRGLDIGVRCAGESIAP